MLTIMTSPLSDMHGSEGDAIVKTEIMHKVDNDSKFRILLATDTSNIYYQVSLSNLRLASPVWNKMLDPKSPFCEGAKPAQNNSSTTILELHDDDPDALLHLFCLMHWKFDQFDEANVKTSPKKMFELAKVCDKYDCTKVAAYVFGQKQHSLTDLWGCNKPLNLQHATVWMYVGYTFQQETIFKEASCYSILHRVVKCKKQEEGDIDDSYDILPEKVAAAMNDVRHDTFNKLVKLVDDFLDKYTFGLVYNNPIFCALGYSTCDIALFGSLIRRLRYANLFPVKKFGKYLSLHELVKGLSEVQIGEYYSTRRRYEETVPHRDVCMDEVKQLLQMDTVALLEAVPGLNLRDFKNVALKRQHVKVEDEEIVPESDEY